MQLVLVGAMGTIATIGAIRTKGTQVHQTPGYRSSGLCIRAGWPHSRMACESNGISSDHQTILKVPVLVLYTRILKTQYYRYLYTCIHIHILYIPVYCMYMYYISMYKCVCVCGIKFGYWGDFS
jgi:hypothetical protein